MKFLSILFLLAYVTAVWGKSDLPTFYKKEQESINKLKKSYLALYPNSQHDKLIQDLDDRVRKQIPADIISRKKNSTTRKDIDQLFDEYITSFLEEKITRRFYLPKGWWIEDLQLKDGSIICGYLLECNQKDSLFLHKKIWVRLGQESSFLYGKEMKIMFDDLEPQSRIRFGNNRKIHAEKYKKEITAQYLSELSVQVRNNIFGQLAEPHGFFQYNNEWYAPDEFIFIKYYAPIYRKELNSLFAIRQKELLTPIHTKHVRDIIQKARKQATFSERLEILKPGLQYYLATNMRELKEYIALTERQERELRERIARLEEEKRLERERQLERERLARAEAERKRREEEEKKRRAERAAIERQIALAKENESKQRAQGKRRINIFKSDGSSIIITLGGRKVAAKIRYYINDDKVSERDVENPSAGGPWVKVNIADKISAEIILKHGDNSQNVYKTKDHYYDGEDVIRLRLQSIFDQALEEVIAK